MVLSTRSHEYPERKSEKKNYGLCTLKAILRTLAPLKGRPVESVRPSVSDPSLREETKSHKLIQHKIFGPHPETLDPERNSSCASFFLGQTGKKVTHINFIGGI